MYYEEQIIHSFVIIFFPPLRAPRLLKNSCRPELFTKQEHFTNYRKVELIIRFIEFVLKRNLRGLVQLLYFTYEDAETQKGYLIY